MDGVPAFSCLCLLSLFMFMGLQTISFAYPASCWHKHMQRTRTILCIHIFCAYGTNCPGILFELAMTCDSPLTVTSRFRSRRRAFALSLIARRILHRWYVTTSNNALSHIVASRAPPRPQSKHFVYAHCTPNHWQSVTHL